MFEYLNGITDSSGDIARVINYANDAQEAKNEKRYTDVCLKCGSANITMIKYVYKELNLPEPAERYEDGDGKAIAYMR